MTLKSCLKETVSKVHPWLGTREDVVDENVDVVAVETEHLVVVVIVVDEDDASCDVVEDFP